LTALLRSMLRNKIILARAMGEKREEKSI